jgi:hypothetical protein
MQILEEEMRTFGLVIVAFCLITGMSGALLAANFAADVVNDPANGVTLTVITFTGVTVYDEVEMLRPQVGEYRVTFDPESYGFQLESRSRTCDKL